MVATRLLTRLLAGLNDAQREAVIAPPGPLLVLAGPGTGKTRMLAHRVAYALARERVAPGEVLALTFTNRAARELGERAAQLLDQGEAGATVGTFHAIAHRLLRANAHAIGRTSRFSVYDQTAARTLLAEAVRGTGADAAFAGRAISRAKARLVTAADLDDGRNSRVKETWERYEQLLATADALDFDDLLRHAVVLLERGAVRPRWRMVLVDEYQDVNPAQARLALALAGARRDLTAVADDDQAIYGFRCADPGALGALANRLGPVRTVVLEQSYRSRPPILTAAHSLIVRNNHRVAKRATPVREGGDAVVELRVAHAREETARIVEWSQARIAAGAKPGELAVLARTRALLAPVERELVASGLPARTLGAGGFWTREEVRDALAHLTLLSNPCDRVAFARAIAVPRRGIGPAAQRRLLSFAGERCEGSVLRACGRAGEIEGLSAAQRDALTAYSRAMESIASTPMKLGRRVGKALTASGLVARWSARVDADAEARLERLLSIVRAARAFEHDRPSAGLAELLGHLALLDSESGADGAITLATVHAAKGLEWPWVWVLGLTDGAFPHARAGKDGIEEERRLAYVAMTRARDGLVLSWPMRTHGRPERRSRFLAEALPRTHRFTG